MNWKTLLHPKLNHIDWTACFLSGLCLSLAFPPFEWSYFVWIALMPVLSRLRIGLHKENGSLGFFTGLVFHSLHLYWIYKVTIAGLIILIFYLSLLWAAVFYGIGWLITKKFGIFASAFLWAAVEFIRSIPPFTFAWGYLGHALYAWIYLLQVTPWIGVPGLSWLLLGFNLSLSLCIKRIWDNRDNWQAVLISAKAGKETLSFAVFVFLLLLSAGYGSYIVNGLHESEKKGTPFRVALVQGNVPNDPDITSDEQISSYIWFTQQALPQKPDLVIWPECTVPVPINYYPQCVSKIQEFVDQNKVEIATGTIFDDRLSNNGEFISYNSVTLFTPGAQWNLNEVPIPFAQGFRYDKMQLVPFGEYIPFGRNWPLKIVTPAIEKMIESAGVGLKEPGKNLVLFRSAKGIRFGFSICFESSLSAQNAKLKKMGADFLAVITYDTWFDGTVGLKQHFIQSAFRAAENRCYVVRAANSGITAVFNPAGKVIKSIYPYQPGVCVCDLYF